MFTFLETWMTGVITDVTASATTIITSILGLIAFVVGSFYLLGLGKKGVKSAK